MSEQLRAFEIWEALKSENSRKGKTKILTESVGVNPRFRDICRMAYDPTVNYYFSRDIKDLIPETPPGMFLMEEKFDLDDDAIWGDFVELLAHLSSRKVTGNAGIDAIISIYNRLFPSSQVLLNLILKRDLDCGINIKTMNAAWGEDFIPHFQVQLANKFQPGKNYGSDGFYVSTKLDGIRAVYYYDSFVTRNNKPIVGFDFLIPFLEDVRASIAEILEIPPSGVYLLDGELYSHSHDFNKIQSAVMRSKNVSVADTMSLQYNIFGFDVDYKTIKRKTLTAGEMCGVLRDIREKYSDHPHIQIVDQRFLSSPDNETILGIAREFVGGGFEGAMLRPDTSTYTYGRSDTLLKVKFQQEMDMRIMELFAHRKNPNLCGSMRVEGRDEDGRVISVNVGVERKEEQESFFREPNFYIGKQAEIWYDSITPDGTLRFPVFKKLKLDR